MADYLEQRQWKPNEWNVQEDKFKTKNIKKYHHPLIYMKGLRFEDLSAIIDFLYLGEANVFQENLDSFLGIAEELKLKGLTDQTRDTENKKEISSGHPVQRVNSKSLHTIKKPGMKKDPLGSYAQTSPAKSYNENEVAIPNFLSWDLQQPDEKVKSMMESSQTLIPYGKNGKQERAKTCKVCGKEGQSMTIRDHIEAHHIEGICLPCKICGKEYRSRLTLRKHTCIPR